MVILSELNSLFSCYGSTELEFLDSQRLCTFLLTIVEKVTVLKKKDRTEALRVQEYRPVFHDPLTQITLFYQGDARTGGGKSNHLSPF